MRGAPTEVRNFNCKHNYLTNLEGGPSYVSGVFDCNFNPIWNIYYLFPDYKSYIDSLDYNYLRGNDIIKFRFNEAIDELGIEAPDYITEYKYI
jgi:hypothetical protein